MNPDTIISQLGQPVEPDVLAVLAREFEEPAVPGIRDAGANPETLLHRAADSYVLKLRSVVQRAFDTAREAALEERSPTQAVNTAVTTLRKELKAELPAILRRVYAAGGVAGTDLLKQRLRIAGDKEGHPFYGNQWTDLGPNEFAHGTSSDRLESILKNGLTIDQKPRYEETRQGNVYLATTEAEAIYWARNAAKISALKQEGDIAILKVRIPQEEWDKLDNDENFEDREEDDYDDEEEEGGGEVTTMQFKGNIKPEWIVGAKVGKATWKDQSTKNIQWKVLKDLSTGKTVYVAVLLSEMKTLGDVDGHPFYGNQYTDVAGVGKKPKKGGGEFKHEDAAPEKAVKRVLGVDDYKPIAEAMFGSIPGDVAIEAKLTDRGNLIIRGGNRTARATRIFSREKDGTLVVDHDMFQVDDKQQGKGIAKEVLADHMDEYERLGVEYVKTLATLEVGGYAWAKFGFKADSPKHLAFQLNRALPTLKLSDEEQGKVASLIEQYKMDPKLPWHVAGVTSGGRRIGKELLMASTIGWSGVLDLKDQESMDRFRKYVGR